MKIAVIGAGAIGSVIAGYLAEKKEDVYLVGRSPAVEAVRRSGLHISGVRGQMHVSVAMYDTLVSKPDLAILATKTQDIEGVFGAHAAFLEGALILTTQNGIRAEQIVAHYVPQDKIISSIVMFGATYLEPGKVVHNFEGAWILGGVNGAQAVDKAQTLRGVLEKAFTAIVSPDIQGMKYLKIFVNANNCIPAVLGVSMQEAFSDLEVSRISVAIWKEALDIMKLSGRTLVSLPGFPVENVTRLVSLPGAEATKIFSGIMTALSSEPLYGSILQSIKRGRASEIDYINGEFVAEAKRVGTKAPLNAKLVNMVHEVEKTNTFFSKDELLSAVKGLYR